MRKRSWAKKMPVRRKQEEQEIGGLSKFKILVEGSKEVRKERKTGSAP